MTDPVDVSRLPAKIRTYIFDLERRVRELEARADPNPDLTDTFIDRTPTTENPSEFEPLPKGSEVTFWPRAGWPAPKRGRITCRWTDETLGYPGHLVVSGSGMSTALSIRPVSSNVVHVLEVPLS